MALKRFATEFGMGTDLRGQDYTKASVRAVKDALWHNSLTVAAALDKDPSEMIVKCVVAVAKPELVDTRVHLHRWILYTVISAVIDRINTFHLSLLWTDCLV